MNNSQTTPALDPSTFVARAGFGMSTPELTRVGARGLAVEAVRLGAAPVVFPSRIRAPDRLPVTGRDDCGANAAFVFLRELNIKVRQDAVQYLANQSHGASVASCSVSTSHHRRKTGCRPIQTTQEPVS